MLIVEECDGRQHVCACMSPGEHRAVRQDGMEQVTWSADQISVIYRDDDRPAVPTDWALS